MVKRYRDIFGIPLTKQDAVQAVIAAVRTNNPYPANIQRQMRIGYGKALRLTKLLADAGVITPSTSNPRTVILKNEEQAVNATLRQLKKGKK